MSKFSQTLLSVLSFVATLAVAAEPTASPPGSYALTRADVWHRAGFRGKGVKVAVLDVGFRGYATSIGASLPIGVQVKSFRYDRNIEARQSRHGVRCAEIIHKFAPDAELLFIDWQPDVPESFIAAIDWAKQAGARIITCSVVMPSWSDGEGGGPVHQAIQDTIGDDLVCVACAGNLARRHWSGTFQADSDGWHVWPNGSIDNELTPWGNETVSLEISAAQGSFEVFAMNEAGRPVACGSSTARFQPKHRAKYSLRVRCKTRGDFHVAALGSWLDQSTEASSIPFPGDGAEWLTVGAWENGRRAVYSSRGSNSTPTKPDLVAEVPFAINEESPFGGTSAAAPQVAGLAAIYCSRFPKATASEIKKALRLAARDVAQMGVDDESGWGLARLPPIR